MSGLLVFACGNEDGADRMVAAMPSLQEQHAIVISDAATVIREADGSVKIRQASTLVGRGSLGGVFWGILTAVVFFMPWVGISISNVRGAFAGTLANYGISDSFLKDVAAAVGPHHSALFLMASSVADEKLIKVIARHKATLLRTNVSQEDEDRLREAFGESTASEG